MTYLWAVITVVLIGQLSIMRQACRSLGPCKSTTKRTTTIRKENSHLGILTHYLWGSRALKARNMTFGSAIGSVTESSVARALSWQWLFDQPLSRDWTGCFGAAIP